MVYITSPVAQESVIQPVIQRSASLVSWLWIALCSDMDSLLSAPLCKEKSKQEKILILREMRTILQLFMCFECVFFFKFWIFCFKYIFFKMGLSLCLGLLLKTKGFGVTPNKTKKLTKKN